MLESHPLRQTSIYYHRLRVQVRRRTPQKHLRGALYSFPPTASKTAAIIRPSRNVDQSDSVDYYPQDRESGFVLLCTGKPRSALRIRTTQQGEMRQHRIQKLPSAPYS